MKKRGKFRLAIYAIVIGFAVISFWRGIWGLWDVYVFPNNYRLSLWVSLMVGLVILVFTHHLVKELM
ncbi:hypothetical protein GF386_02365 [Candidatus Pacearchaeota archaeon]|nr:hypothetical protein [Candidatus Pacearchaeota archaeon]MBD3283001.1 hypothetical protein [Candidatus Pacearchaeota archaeon]